MSNNVPHIHFYQAPGTTVDKAVRFWTAQRYSHVELELSPGESWSSSPRDGGVRCKPIHFSPEGWYTRPLPWLEVNAARRIFKAHEGKPYDYAGLFLRQVLNTRLKSERMFFCSEIVGAALGLPNPDKYSPGDLAELLVRGWRL